MNCFGGQIGESENLKTLIWGIFESEVKKVKADSERKWKVCLKSFAYFVPKLNGLQDMILSRFVVIAPLVAIFAPHLLFEQM